MTLVEQYLPRVDSATIEKREIMISMDPDMAQKFYNSTHVSCKFFLFC